MRLNGNAGARPLMPDEPLDYATPAEPAARRHNRLYTALLTAMALFCVLGVMSVTFTGRSPTVAPESRWVFEMVAWIYGALIAAIVVTLVLRGAAPLAGRVATKATNIVLLFFFPLGTALGIYGLMKVDKEDAAPVSRSDQPTPRDC
jgi:hypothetical protein